MASSYALPASMMSHDHHGHAHLHSHSHSPSRHPQHPANTPKTKTLRQEKSNGSLYGHSHSDPRHEHTHSHSHAREPSLPTPPDSNGLAPGPFEQQAPESSPALSRLEAFEPSLNALNILPNGHHHRGHSDASHAKSVEPRSRFTSYILPFVLRWPLLHTVMSEKDSRRIFYFMSLNFSFMLVQAFYGYLTDSLGLLSDSIHMFFDCLALAVGLFAAVASKWPPSERFPYGFGKIESLSGFGNGVFLMLISIEIMTEATERLAEGHETKRLAELFVVSGLGLAVNLIGMACFGHHGHAGHDHGHSHGPSHDHSHSYSQGENYSHDEHHHDHSHDCDQDHNSLKAGKAHAHVGHSHSHDNENMHGIFLHVLADTMGSAAVMVSTALIYFVGWNGWDPLASCVIAILIFLSSIPLIKSCAKKLLLTVPDNVEYSLRETLSGVSDIRGVASYFVPRFWMGDKNTDSENEQVLGVMHIIATRGSDLDDVRERTRAFLLSHGMDVVVQVEKDADTSCWCGGSSSRTLSRFS